MPVNEVLRPVAASLNSHRVLLYSFISTVAVSAAIANALKSHSNFYSVAIFLSKSSRSVLILANFGFLVALFCGHVVQQIFFGSLRAAEIERLYDRLWFFVTESLLAFTIFRDEFDIPFALMFGFLLFVKSFHWLAADRIEWMDQRPYPGPPPLFHVRMAGLFVILYTTDFLMFIIAAEHTMTNGVGGMVLFASEYAVLMASALNTIAKYLLSAFELRRAGRRGGENAPPWENKSMWVFYIELITDFLKLTTYLIFFTVIITFYGLPLNIVRDVYITARSFVTRLRALHRYQTATRNMDQRYPNATEEEMAAMSDRTCIICREEMLLPNVVEDRSDDPPAQAPAPVPDGPNTTPKKLPCGHIFHFHCLRMWLERQQSCPTCRRSVLETSQPGQHTPAGDARGPQQQGGIPQPPPNLFGVPAPGLNNPLGLVGRLFGAGGQPPIVPGQLPHGQFPPHPAVNVPQNPINFGFGPGQQPPPGVVIQYHIQYLPRQYPQPPPAPAPPQQLQPVPPFAGFHGPGGVWQPWGMHQRWFEPGQNPPQPEPPRVPATPPTVQQPSPTPTLPRPQSNPPPPSPPMSSESSSSTVSNDSEQPSTPREAAALAALRRFSANSTARPSNRSAGTSGSVVSTSGEPEAPSVLQPPPVDSGLNASPNPGTQSPNGRLDIPIMIPLPDYGPPGITPTPQGPVQSPYAPAPPFYRAPPGVRQTGYFAPQHMPGAQIQTGAQRPQPGPSTPRVNADSRHHHPRTPITQLPPALTDEQLSSMDRVTREAIDERLRVLEGVSGAVYRCIDDLMRMRSALPTPTPVAPAAPAAPAAPVAPVAPASRPHSDASGSSPVALVRQSIPHTSESFNDGIPQESASSGSELIDALAKSLPDTTHAGHSESPPIPQEDNIVNDGEP